MAGEINFSVQEFINWAKSRESSSKGHDWLRFKTDNSFAAQEAANKMQAFQQAIKLELLNGTKDELNEFFNELTFKLREAKLITGDQDWTDYSYSSDPNRPNFEKAELEILEKEAKDLVSKNRPSN